MLILAILLLCPVPDAASQMVREASLYHYRATVTKVIDGDTIVANVDLGMNVWRHGERLRLARVDTPEVRGADRTAGLEARRFVASLLLNRRIIIQTIRDRKGKYGRYLAEVWLEGRNINDLLVDRGFAVYRGY